MLLIADSGSTKTDWHLCGAETDFRMKTGGLHPHFSDRKAVGSDLWSFWPEGISMEDVSLVHFYGSGCLSPAGADIIRTFLSELFSAEIFVHSDLEGATISTLGNRPGIAAILGTGSSAALWDGKAITSLSPSLGYLLGDEGSGADIAKHLLRDLLYEDAGEEAARRFYRMYPVNPSQIISKLYRHPKPAAHLAGYCRFLSENTDLPYCTLLLQQRFSAFIQRHLIPLKNNKTLPLGLIGGIAFVFQDILRQELLEAGFLEIHIKQAPIDALVQYHKKEKGW